MKYSYKKIAALCFVSFVGYLSMDYHVSPASQGLRATGASFDGQTCNGCHSGGSYTTTATIQLLHAGTPVTTYNIGGTYTVRVTRTTTGTPAGFGFQITCCKSTSPYSNVNAWGTSLPATTANHLSSSHNYIEQTNTIANSITQLDFPWIGPASGTGNVTFWLSLNTVDGTGGQGGDKVSSTSLIVTASGLPVTWLYFNGKEENNQTQLEWAASYEKDCQFYTVEKSNDGNDFTELAKINSKNNENGTSIYNTIDANPCATTYYRVKQTDFNGQENYFRTIVVKKNTNTNNTSYYYNGEVVVNLETEKTEMVNASLFAIDGRKVASFPVYLNSGINRITYPKPEMTGLYFINIYNASGVVYDSKIMVP